MSDLGSSGLARLAERQAEISAALSRTATTDGVEQVLVRAAAFAQSECRAQRVCIAAVDGRELASLDVPLADAASDELRLRLLSSPVRPPSGSREQHALRAPRDRAGQRKRPSHLASCLDLACHEIAPVCAAGDLVVALLIVERVDRPFTVAENAALTSLAVVTGLAAELAISRARIAEIAASVRYLSTSALGLMEEAITSSPALPRHERHGMVFSLSTAHAARDAPELAARLTRREAEVAELMMHGLSNREIAERLVVSTETVKAHVSNILRKLDVSNRTEAVSRYRNLQRQAN